MAVILNVWAVFIFSKIFILSDGIFCYYVYFHRCEWPNIEQIITHLATLVKCVTRQVYQTILGSGCGSVGRAVISDTRGLRFESRHWQIFIYIEHLLTVNCVLKRRK